MSLTIRHLTGSRAGQEATFSDSDEVTIGRHPSNKIPFDPEKDRVVSGNHASIVYTDQQWLLRDLGSSNGTFIEGSPVTERVLRPGEIVQLGKNGPKIQVQFDSPVQPRAGYAMPANEPAPTPEGRTVMMSFPQAGAAPAGQAAPYYAAPKKKGGIGRALLIVGGVFVVLIVGLVALALVVRSVNVRRQAAVAAATKAKIEEKQQEAQKLNAAIAQKQQEVAQTQAQIQQAQSTTAPSASTAAPATAETDDLKRQLAESQALLEQMTRDLQAKNDEIEAERARAASAAQRRAVPSPRPSIRQQEVGRGIASPTRPTTVAPPVSPTQSSAQQVTTPAMNPPVVVPSATTAPTVQTTAASAAVFQGKKLKKKLAVTTTPPEIPPAGMPASIARDLAAILGDSLISTGDFVVGQRGQASVNVMITNYRSVAQKTVDTTKATESVRAIGGLLGRNVPSNPVEVKSVAYDAGMSLKIRLYDQSGRTVSEVGTSAEAQDRKTRSSLAGVSFREIALSDSATGDVARKVIGDAIDTLRQGMTGLEWTTAVENIGSDTLTLGSGRESNIEPGDVFEIIDGRKTAGRVHVTSITDSSAECEWITAKPKLGDKLVAKYLGSESQSNRSSVPRTLTVRAKTSSYEGPGLSFREIGPLKNGTRLQFQYSVGSWAKVSDGGRSFWVPLASVTINS